MVGLVFLIFFAVSLLTNILGPLIPDIIKSFSLSLGMAGFLPFAFFVAYGVMSIPSGMLVERYREKAVIAAAFAVAFAGSVAFALVPTFATALPSLFLIGIGMAMLQVAINPLLRVAGGERQFAFLSVAAQLVFGLASFISPQIYSYLVSRLGPGSTRGGNAIVDALAGVVPPALPVGLDVLGVHGRDRDHGRGRAGDAVSARRARGVRTCRARGPRTARSCAIPTCSSTRSASSATWARSRASPTGSRSS